jgi:hypothetical protein
VIATGFGGRQRRRRAEPVTTTVRPPEAADIRARLGRTTTPSEDDVEIDVPSFLRDE